MNASKPMNSGDRLSAANRQLDLILSFFPRVDGKLSVVLGLDVAMLGVISTRAPDIATLTAWMWAATLAFLCLCVGSLIFLYRGSFPQLNGGSSSLVYFREIAKRREVDFVGGFEAMSADELASDILCQAWRNAAILSQKFDALKISYRLMALSALPWVVALVMFPMTQVPAK